MADGLTISADLTSLNRVIADLGNEIQLVLAAALYEQMLDVMDRAKELTPVLTGALRDSGRVNRVNLRRGQVDVSLDFGVDPHLDYAVDQHENLTYNHPRGGQAKFLEQALMEWVSRGGPASVIQDVELYLGKRVL